MTATRRISCIASVVGASLSLLAGGPAGAQSSSPEPTTNLTHVDLRGKTLTVRAACESDTAVELRAGSRPKRTAELRCRSGRAKASFRLTSTEATRAASTAGVKVELRLRGSKAQTLEFLRPALGQAREPRARTAANLYWNIAYASCTTTSGIREVGFHTNNATFGYRYGTPIYWQAAVYVYNPYNGAAAFKFNPTANYYLAGLARDSTGLYPASGLWVRPLVQIVGGDWNWLNVVPLANQNVSHAAPNWCYYH